jgi:hypothetical protein
MRQFDPAKLQLENQRLKMKLEAIRDRLRQLKRIPCAGLPEHVASGPEFTGCWTMLPLFSRTMLRAVLGPAISTKVIEALDALYKSAELPVTR